MNTQKVDFAIIGGGVTGLWLNALLARTGFSTILIEKTALGVEQTLASQGMIHGGVKYSLSGLVNNHFDTLKGMPDRWMKCLSGDDPVDLRNVKILSPRYYMFSDESLSSKLVTFLGSLLLRSHVSPVKSADFPKAFNNPKFKGNLYELKDIVIDTKSLVENLTRGFETRIVKGHPEIVCKEGRISSLIIDGKYRVEAEKYILAAGVGNQEIINTVEIPLEMQNRPLHQVVIRGENLPDLFAHAVSIRDLSKPRITFTTHILDRYKYWYLGGELAESGAKRTSLDQIKFAKEELKNILPWIDFSECVFSTFKIDRAEPKSKKNLKPTKAFVRFYKNTIVCWPTKLALTPQLGDDVLSNIFTKPNLEPKLFPAERPEIGKIPWI